MRPRMTPLEVQRREFSRRWKGLDPVEVQQFLTDVAEDMEALARENADLDVRLRTLEQENEEHRERERILKQTLLSAQQASEDIRNAARKEGELIVREAQDSSERLTHSALQRSAEIEKAIGENRRSFKAPTSLTDTPSEITMQSGCRINVSMSAWLDTRPHHIKRDISAPSSRRRSQMQSHGVDCRSTAIC